MTEQSWLRFKAYYACLRSSYPHLLPTPFGIFLGDEPPPSTAPLLVNATRLVKDTFSNATTYLNWKWGDLTGTYPEARNASVARWVGRSELDWVVRRVLLLSTT